MPSARPQTLEAENRRLRDQVAMLEDALGATFRTPPHWRLTPSEEVVFGVLYRRAEVVSFEAFLTALYSDRAGEEPLPGIVKSFVMRLRRKLRPYGIDIGNSFARGYYLLGESRARATAQLERTFAGPGDG